VDAVDAVDAVDVNGVDVGEDDIFVPKCNMIDT
jgi:hypothetical protein